MNSASPYYSLKDLLDAATSKPGRVTFGSFMGTGAHIAFEMLKHSAGADITLIPYAGSAPAITDLLGQQVSAVSDNYATMAQYIKAGKLRALATFAHERLSSLPDVPTVAESGYKDVEVDEWFGLFTPAHTPKETVSQVAAWFGRAVQDVALKEKLAPLGLFPTTMTSGDFGSLLRHQYDEYGRAIREGNLKVE